jgi:hypothetical protein
MGHFTLKPDPRVLWWAENPAIGAMIRHRKRTSRKAKETIGRPKKWTGIETGQLGAAPGGIPGRYDWYIRYVRRPYASGRQVVPPVRHTEIRRLRALFDQFMRRDGVKRDDDPVLVRDDGLMPDAARD